MRIGINVPNDLIQRVKAVQPDVNISRVCREALEELVSRQDLVEIRVNADGTAERILEFSRSQDNPLVEPDWAGYAWEDAKEWVSKVTPDEWDDFCESYDYDESAGVGFDTVVLLHGNFFKWEQENEAWFRQRFRQLRKSNGNAKILDSAKGPLDSAKRKYNDSWLSYVRKVRQKQRDFFEAEYKRHIDEIDKRVQARLSPEVPPHLLEP